MEEKIRAKLEELRVHLQADGGDMEVVKIEGIVLEVEPLVGAAVDYREKRGKKSE